MSNIKALQDFSAGRWRVWYGHLYTVGPGKLMPLTLPLGPIVSACEYRDGISVTDGKRVLFYDGKIIKDMTPPRV